jgi:hypothetical protein
LYDIIMNTEDFLKQIETDSQTKDLQKQKALETARQEKQYIGVVNKLNKLAGDITSAIDKKTEVAITNFPESVKPKDIERLILEIKALKTEVVESDPADHKAHELLQNLLNAVSAIKIDIPEPKDFPKEISVNNQKDYTKQIGDVVDAVKAIKMDFKPNISVKPTDVKLSQDFTTIEKKLDMVEKAIKAINIVVPAQNDARILKSLAGVSKAINSLSFSVPNYILPFKDTSGSATQVQLDSDGKLPVSATISTTGLATETTLAKTVSFDENDDLTVSIVTAGTVKTITETDGVRTRTTVIDKTDPNSIPITVTWS